MSTDIATVRYNFAPGPAQLPKPVLEEAAQAVLNFDSSERSILELSHRSDAFDAVAERAESDLRDLLSLSDDYAVLFLSSGTRTHYGLWTLNISAPDARIGMTQSGYWSRMAADEAGRFRSIVRLEQSDPSDYPEWDPYEATALDYVHYVSNETLTGLAMPEPEVPCPLVCDHTSDFLSEPIDLQPYALCYAGAQKNFGCAGLTLAIVRRELLREEIELPKGLDYHTQMQHQCRYYTPATYAWYVASLYLRWIREEGGLEVMAQRAEARAQPLYAYIDDSSLYSCAIAPRARSRMNVCFQLSDESLLEAFLEQAEAQGLAGLRGHSAVGGIRASLYNAMPIAGAEALASFMHEFERTA